MCLDVLSNLIITKIYSCNTMFIDKSNIIDRKNRASWAISIKHEGETKYFSKGETLISNANNIILLPKGSSYKWHCTQAGRVSIVEFESNAVCDELYIFPKKNNADFLKRIEKIEHITTLGQPLHEIESIKEVYSILLMLLKAVPHKYYSKNKTEKITPALEYIAENYTQKITNEFLANLTGLSTEYFRKIFLHSVGISPITYVHQLRIKKAKQMLKSDYVSITEVANILGYSNIYEFSRDFKKHVGVSPSKY